MTGLALGADLRLVALGYTLVYGVLRLINFAHSEVFMLGTFAAVCGHRALGVEPGAPVLIAIGLLLVGAARGDGGQRRRSLLLERVAYRPLRRLQRAHAGRADLARSAPASSSPSDRPPRSVGDFFGFRESLDRYLHSARRHAVPEPAGAHGV